MLQLLASPAGIWATMGAFAALIWVTVVFVILRRTASTGSRIGARSLIWVVGLSPAIAQFIAPHAVFSNNILVDSPPLTGNALLVSQGMSLIGLTLSALIIATQWPTAGAERPGRGPVMALLAIYAAVAFAAILGGNGGFDRHLIVLPLACLALYVAPRLSAPELVWQLRLILRLYVYGSLVALIVAPSWALIARTEQTRDYFGIGGQLSGLTPHPNALGAVAATALMAELAPLRRRRTWPIHASASALVLLLAQSRTAFIAAIIGLMFLRSTHRSTRPMRWAGVSLLMALGTAFVLSPKFATQAVSAFSGNSDLQTLNGRTKVWDYAYDQFLANPVTGFGPNLFDRESPGGMAGKFPTWAGQAHNQVFQTLGETGIIGAIAVVTFVLVLLTAAARRSRPLAGLSAAMVAILLTRFISESPLSSNGGYDSSFMLVFFLIAVVITPLEVAAPAEPEGVSASLRPAAMAAL